MKSLFTLLLVGLCSAACTKESRGQRRAWHTFSDAEKSSYIDAELCLMKKAPSIGLKGAKSRFDEFQAVHQLQAFATHYVGAFLPFHRALLFAHEDSLRTECGYKGWQPYWEEQLDSGKFKQSVVFNSTLGFGGDGSGTNKCITTGPFAKYTLRLGPGYQYTDHCITRQISETYSAFTAQRYVNECLTKTTWLTAWNCIENNPHFGGHGGVGELMMDGVASPGDPLFYLHHTWLDKIWADWQAKDLSKRLTEMGGTNIQDDRTLPPSFAPRPSNIPKPTGADGDPGTTTTLKHVLNMYGNGPNRTIADVMDIWNGTLCYEYVPVKLT